MRQRHAILDERHVVHLGVEANIAAAVLGVRAFDLDGAPSSCGEVRLVGNQSNGTAHGTRAIQCALEAPRRSTSTRVRSKRSGLDAGGGFVAAGGAVIGVSSMYKPVVGALPPTEAMPRIE